MLQQNLRIFALALVIILLFILLKNGQIFDLGFVFRKTLVPQRALNSPLKEPDNLSTEYQILLAKQASLQTLYQENQELRQLLDFKAAKKYNLVLANILSRDPVNLNLLIIDAGANQGIKIGQAVVVNQGIMVGKVIEVSTDSAKVRLLTDGFSKLTVSLDQQTNVIGLLTGSLGLSMNLSYIPQAQEVKKNDLLVTANLDSNIPPGLVIGKVEEVKFSAEELFKQAAVAPLLDFNTLSIVAVVTSL